MRETVSLRGVTCLRATAMALLCEVKGREVWIPKSQVDDDSEVYEEGGTGCLVIPEWLAIEKGLV